MAQSNSYNLTTTRDGIITRALRIIGAIGQGETPSAAAITEGAEALNDLVKEWEAEGMPLWALTEYTLTPVASTTTYTVGVGSTIATVAPMKVIGAWRRQTSTNTDTPLDIISRDDYDKLPAKSTTGTVTHLMYVTPGGISSTENQGTVYLYQTPDANFVATYTIRFLGTRPFMDFDTSTDVPDFPQYWYNAIKWGLAGELAYEYGVPQSSIAQIHSMAEFHKSKAMSFDTEEGSMKISTDSRNG